MGIRQLEIFYSFSAGIDFRRQNLTSIGPIRQILTSKVSARAKRVPPRPPPPPFFLFRIGRNNIGFTSSTSRVCTKLYNYHDYI